MKSQAMWRADAGTVRHPKYPLVRMRQVGNTIILTVPVQLHGGSVMVHGGHVCRADYDCVPSFTAEVNQLAEALTARCLCSTPRTYKTAKENT